MFLTFLLSLLPAALAADPPPGEGPLPSEEPADAASLVDIEPILPSIVGCARSHLAADPQLAAQLQVHLTFAEGRIAAASVRLGEEEHPAATACLSDAVRGQALARAPADGRVILRWPHR